MSMNLHWALARRLIAAVDDPDRTVPRADAEALSRLGLAAFGATETMSVRVLITELGRAVAERHRDALSKRRIGNDHFRVRRVTDSSAAEPKWSIFSAGNTCIAAGLDSWTEAQRLLDSWAQEEAGIGGAMQSYRRILAALARHGAATGLDLRDGAVPREVVAVLRNQGDARLDETGSLLTLTLQGRERAALVRPASGADDA